MSIEEIKYITNVSEKEYKDVAASFGITTRDYFAAKAMQVMCMNADTWGLQADSVALEAYAMADAMLRAREHT